MIPDEHDGHLLPGCQEFEAEIVGDLDQALVRIGVDGMTILEDPLVHGRRGQVDGRIGGIAMLHAAGHLQRAQQIHRKEEETKNKEQRTKNRERKRKERELCY